MPTILPLDANRNVIPALRLLDSGGAHKITVTSTSARNSTAFQSSTRIVSLYATGGVYVRFGNSSVTATTSDHYFPAGIYYDMAIGGGDHGVQFTHIAAIRADSDCFLYISEKC